MSSFAGIPFKVMVENESFFPTPVLDDDGKYVYNCRAFIDTLARREALAGWVSLVTWRRPLGTISIIGHIEAGKGASTLYVPEAAGALKGYSAVLGSMNGVQVYGRMKNRGFTCDLSFVLLSDPWS